MLSEDKPESESGHNMADAKNHNNVIITPYPTQKHCDQTDSVSLNRDQTDSVSLNRESDDISNKYIDQLKNKYENSGLDMDIEDNLGVRFRSISKNNTKPREPIATTPKFTTDEEKWASKLNEDTPGNSYYPIPNAIENSGIETIANYNQMTPKSLRPSRQEIGLSSGNESSGKKNTVIYANVVNIYN